MSFQPIVPISGLAGWRFLERTMDNQKEAFSQSPVRERETAYFEKHIGGVTTAEKLVNDRRLLHVALGAFGLSDDINNKYFIRKVLEEGTSDPGALANRLSDSRYKKLSEAFGFANQGLPNTQMPNFANGITTKYLNQEFAVAVGNSDETMRLALNAKMDLSTIAKGSGSDDAKWYMIMGTPPLRTVFETAFGFPSGFGSLDLERQLNDFRDRAKTVMGNGEISQFSDPENVEKLIETYLLRSQISSVSVASPSSIALSLLQISNPA